MRRIKRIESSTPQLPSKKRVAAYARVSVDKGRTLHSLSAQVSHYSAFIQKNTNWEYVGVYADEAISGTSDNRPEFQRLLADCEADKIDIILTKSISRFARNTVDLLETVRWLKEIGVEVRFEKEKINSLDGDGELMLSILASFAQEESRSLSENVKWAIRKGFKEGKPNSFNIYGYRWDGQKFIVHPEEAEVVRMIFKEYLDGNSPRTISRKLNKLGIKPMYAEKFPESSVLAILKNDKYTGDLRLQKTFVENHITKRERKNNGELPMYLVKNAHEPIIDRETFVKVQKEKERRRLESCFANPAIKTSALTSKIKCGNCGASFRRKSEPRKGNRKYYVWMCATKEKKGVALCSAKTIPENTFKKVCAEVLGLVEFDENKFSAKVSLVTVPKDHMLVFHLKDGTKVTKTWKTVSKKDVWTDEMRQTARERMMGNQRWRGKK